MTEHMENQHVSRLEAVCLESQWPHLLFVTFCDNEEEQKVSIGESSMWELQYAAVV